MIESLKKKMLKKLNEIFKSRDLNQVIITLILRVIGILLLFGFTLFLTNNYKPEVVGDYELIRTFLLIIGSLTVLGTEQSILYFIGKLTSSNSLEMSLSKLYFNILKLIFISSLCLVFIFIILPKDLILDFYNRDHLIYNYIKKSVFLCFFYSVTIFNTEMLRALNHINLSEIFRNILKYSIVIIGSMILLYTGDSIWLIDFYIYGFIILSIISTIVVLIDINKKDRFKNYHKIEFDDSLVSIKSIIIKSYPMAISGLCFFVMLSVDIMLLKKYFGSESVAYYSIAIKLLTILSMVIIAVNINIAPKISEFYHSNKTYELKEILNKSRKIICFMNIPIGIFLILFGKKVLLFFGQNYLEVYYPMIILLIGQIIASFFGSTAITLNMIGQQNRFQFILLFATLLNIIFNIILTPKYGMIGSAISFVVSLLFWNIVSFITFIKSSKLNTL